MKTLEQSVVVEEEHQREVLQQQELEDAAVGVEEAGERQPKLSMNQTKKFCQSHQGEKTNFIIAEKEKRFDNIPLFSNHFLEKHKTMLKKKQMKTKRQMPNNQSH